MNIASYAQRFFLFGGALLIAIAILQMLMRRRTEGARPTSSRMMDPTFVRAGFFVLVGVAAILVGAGVIPLGGRR